MSLRSIVFACFLCRMGQENKDPPRPAKTRYDPQIPATTRYDPLRPATILPVTTRYDPLRPAERACPMCASYGTCPVTGLALHVWFSFMPFAYPGAYLIYLCAYRGADPGAKSFRSNFASSKFVRFRPLVRLCCIAHEHEPHTDSCFCRSRRSRRSR